MEGIDPREFFWLRQAKALRMRINMGWWWEVYLRFALAGAALASLGLMFQRLREGDVGVVWLTWGLWMLLSCLGVLRWTRKRFIREGVALSRLDVALGLHHRLVSAQEGVGKWPDIPKKSRSPVKWKPPALAVPLLLCACFLGMGAWLPLPANGVDPLVSRTEPPEWKALESLAEELREHEWLREDAVERIKNEVAELRAKAPETWYRPGSLEATGQLRQDVQNDSFRLREALQQTAALLDAVAARGAEMGMEQQQELREFFQQALNQLGEGGMPLDATVLKQLQQLDLSQLGELNEAQLAQLLEMVEGMEGELGEILLASGMLNGSDDPGAGGISRGGGPAALSLKDKASAVEAATPLALNNPDRTRAAMGDLLEVQHGTHEELSETPGGSGGTVASPGGGGDVVWKADVLPSEQKILQSYFK